MKLLASRKVLTLFVSIFLTFANVIVLYSQSMNFPNSALLLRAQAGDAQAQVEVGKLYCNGTKDLPVDYFAAYEWFNKAVKQENVEAMYQIGRMHNRGEIGPLELKYAPLPGYFKGFYIRIPSDINYSKALSWYMSASDLNHAGAQKAIADIYRIERTDKRQTRMNADEAISWYLKSADNGNGYAMVCLFEIYQFGWIHNDPWAGNSRIVKKDKNEAKKWYDKIIEQGEPEVLFNLGTVLFYRGNKKQKEEAVKLFHNIAEQNVAWAQYYLGESYTIGVSVNRNLTEAVKWYRRAGENGDAHLQYYIATEIFSSGMVRGQFYNGILDKNEAAKLLRVAAENGNALMHLQVAERYDIFDAAERFKLYLKAAEEIQSMMTPINAAPLFGANWNWYYRARHSVGVMYNNGQGVLQDKNEAEKWLIKYSPYHYDTKKERTSYYMNLIGWNLAIMELDREFFENWNARWSQIDPK